MEFVILTTLGLLVLAALVFTFQTFAQLKKGSSGAGFPVLLLLVILGWIVTEVAHDALGTSMGDVGRWTHLSVMFLFAAAMTFELRRARSG